ncbi:Abhydrolase domain-containing protein abhd-5.2 [Caenorhabditis elegans]|uniref:Isoform b of Abhydrolase domain-containing protein abhd-5.2 n=1 Tax=Caenorhabditis elegans TaxID=6239 RepID=H2KZ86-2|nr:Abhydrolase domain-containing protein abhd-5.2 [Caenorhabditis elegans]CCD66982.1 Abhydrolase domain-containing protein abhd-5.2 [Caenorhabditis elegans]|eukprot:NP_872178.1 Abhydrolase domain-containing protein abhd-5.2 [Caenorhabditis elegans]
MSIFEYTWYLSWIPSRFPYFSCPSKSQRLAEAEGRILSALGIKYLARLIQIPFKNTEISTITVNCESEQPIVKAKYPIVLIHGFGAGVALWGSAIKRLAQFQTVHAFDLPGFGRSSRPKFSSDPETAETEMIDSIEQWRDKMNLEKMNLVGHSFGGYLATSYALKYPKRVENLILADPWGFNEMDPEFAQKLTSRQKNIFWVIQQFNPLAVLRLVGGYGPSLVRRLRPDLALKYSEDVYDYIYLANSRDPTGEEVFKCLSENLGWAKQPMSKRFHELDNTVPVTFIHGERSWIDWRTTRRLFGELEHVESHIMDSAGHHVYADDADKFVQLVIGSLKDGKTGELVPEEVNLEEEIVTPI